MSEVSNRRFVHFDGTKQEFIDGGYDEMYSNSIVFINEKDANNRLIYTHGEYYGVIVDNYLNEYSTNAIRNKTVYNEIENLRDEYYTQLTLQIANTTIAKGDAESSAKLLNAGNKSTGIYSVSLGKGSSASGEASFACGNSVASGSFSHSEGGVSTDTNGVIRYTKAIGHSSHAEGAGSHASGYASHAEGEYTTANNNRTHAEGYNTLASGKNSHAEGEESIAQGQNSHSEGYGAQAIGNISHAEGRGCIANGRASHATGWYTVTTNEAEFACGKYNNSRKYTIFSVGYGTNENNRASLFEIRSNGNYSDETHNGTAYFKSGIDIRGHQSDAEVGRMEHNYALTCTSAEFSYISVINDVTVQGDLILNNGDDEIFTSAFNNSYVYGVYHNTGFYNDNYDAINLYNTNVVSFPYISFIAYGGGRILLKGLSGCMVYTIYIPYKCGYEEMNYINIELFDSDFYFDYGHNKTKRIQFEGDYSSTKCACITMMTTKESTNSDCYIATISNITYVDYHDFNVRTYDCNLYYKITSFGDNCKIDFDIIQNRQSYIDINLYLDISMNGASHDLDIHGMSNVHTEGTYNNSVMLPTSYTGTEPQFHIIGLMSFGTGDWISGADLFSDATDDIFRLNLIKEY